MKMLIALRDWVDARLPIQRAWDTHMGNYYAPKNFNFWYIFGVLSLFVLVNQLLTGFWLTMMFNPSAEGAFASVEYIMRDVEYGWIIRYLHSTGASAFFAVVYLHMFRGLLYGSYQKPRELVWIIGMLIYAVLMAEGFMGYVLPWGQMSFWGAQVIVSLFGAIPVVGADLVQWIRGDYLISGITLNRFFALHVCILPIILLALVLLHILALHEVGSNNPDGVEIKKNKDENGKPKDGIPFHPYYTVHDVMGIVVFLFVFCTIVFFFPEWALLPREGQLRGGQPAEDPGAHRPGVVLHPVLRHAARGDRGLHRPAGQVLGLRGHGGRHRDLLRGALAGPQQGQVLALQGLDEQDRAADLPGGVHPAGLPGRHPRLRHLPGYRARPGGGHPDRDLLPVLPADARLHQHREDQAGS